MEIHAAISKIGCYASTEQGNKVEIIERPNGGISIVMAEVKLEEQISQDIAISTVHDVIKLIAEGVPDGASSKRILSKIHKKYKEEVKINLSILSCDLQTNTIVITKNNTIPVLIIENGKCRFLPINEEPETIRYSPAVYQFEFRLNQSFILYSEGIHQAGSNTNNPIDVCISVGAIFDEDGDEAKVQEVSDFILKQAITHDSGRPRDDMTVVVLRVSPSSSTNIRRESVSFPIT